LPKRSDKGRGVSAVINFSTEVTKDSPRLPEKAGRGRIVPRGSREGTYVVRAFGKGKDVSKNMTFSYERPEGSDVGVTSQHRARKQCDYVLTRSNRTGSFLRGGQEGCDERQKMKLKKKWLDFPKVESTDLQERIVLLGHCPKREHPGSLSS